MGYAKIHCAASKHLVLRNLWYVRNLSLQVLVEIFKSKIARITTLDEQAWSVRYHRSKRLALSSACAIIRLRTTCFGNFEPNTSFFIFSTILLLKLLKRYWSCCHFGDSLDKILRMQFEAEVLLEQTTQVYYCPSAFFWLMRFFPKVGNHQLAHNLIFFLIYKNNIFSDPVNLIAFLFEID